MIAEHSLSTDLENSVMIQKKITDTRYAQNLYAAMCNMRWQKTEPWPVLKNELWSCTWRSAGGIVAELQGQGDYLTWYCSGIMDPEEQVKTGFVSEGVVTEEIQADLAALGWHPVPWLDEDLS